MEHVNEIREVTTCLPTQQFHSEVWHKAESTGVASAFLQLKCECSYADRNKEYSHVISSELKNL
jgi:hypothetical protein